MVLKNTFFWTVDNNFIENVYIPEDDREYTLRFVAWVAKWIVCFAWPENKDLGASHSCRNTQSDTFYSPKVGKVDQPVFMGMGEPLDEFAQPAPCTQEY